MHTPPSIHGKANSRTSATHRPLTDCHITRVWLGWEERVAAPCWRGKRCVWWDNEVVLYVTMQDSGSVLTVLAAACCPMTNCSSLQYPHYSLHPVGTSFVSDYYIHVQAQHLPRCVGRLFMKATLIKSPPSPLAKNQTWTECGEITRFNSKSKDNDLGHTIVLISPGFIQFRDGKIQQKWHYCCTISTNAFHITNSPHNRKLLWRQEDLRLCQRPNLAVHADAHYRIVCSQGTAIGIVCTWVLYQ